MRGIKTVYDKSTKRAVSTVIGSFFFIVIMVGAFGAFILMMQTNSEFLNTQLDTTQNEIQKIQGQFTITAAYDSEIGNRLCVSVKSSGSTPLEIADLLIVNKTDNSVRLFDIDFRDAFVPVSSIRDILANQPITLKPGIHDIKVVSASGITQTVELKVFATSSPDPRFNVTAFAYPVNAASGQNVTVGMHVYNRANTTLINVQPDGDPTVNPAEAVSEGFPLVTQSIISRLDPNENALFMWEPEFVGGVGSKLNFTVRAKALVEGCTISSSFIRNSDFALVKVVPGVRKEIFAKPELLVSIPNPFGIGGSADRGLFSMVIENPTSVGFTVSQVAFEIISPTEILKDPVVGVTPSTGGTWSRVKNVVLFTATTPIFISPFGIKEFIVAVESTNVAGDFPIQSIIFNVYSSLGQFSRGPLAVGTYDDVTAIVHLFAKPTFSGTISKYAFSNIPSGSGQRFNFTIHNAGDQSVLAGAFMLINIPPGLRDITNVTTTAGTDGLSAGLEVRRSIEFDDGSTQIPVKLTTDLIASANRTYSFRAIMPTLSVPAHYVFTVVANGTTASVSHALGPFSEVVVQVCPTGGC